MKIRIRPMIRSGKLSGAVLGIFSGLTFAHVGTAEEDLTAKVLQIFENSCKECHHPDTDGELPDLHAEIKIADLLVNFDDYLDKTPLVPGDPEASGIVHRSLLGDDSRKRMPKSKGSEGDAGYRAPLTEEEKDTLVEWVKYFKKEDAVVADTEPAKEEPASDDKPAEAPKTPIEPIKVEDLPEPDAEVVKEASKDQEKIDESASLEERVRHIFQSNCTSCHYPDHDFPDLSQTVNLNLLLKPDSGGSTVASHIIDRINRDPADKERMPRSAGKPGDAKYMAPLTDEEKAILTEWASSTKKASKKREVVSFGDVVDSIYDDVMANKAEARFFRYFTLSHLFSAMDKEGNPQVDDATMDSHRAAIGKLMNSLSSHGRITFPEAIDENKTVYRIDLRDYRWTHEDWSYIVDYYPHGIIGVDSRKENLIARETGSKMSYLRADWFAFAAAQPPLYHDILDRILDLPNKGKETDYLARIDERLGVDRAYNLQHGDALRAGFHRSGVSSANRLIERHDLGSHRGAYWISYDFKLRGGGPKTSLFRAPLGPAEADLTDNDDHCFEHDGGEVIYSLPNGLQAYALVTATGKRLSRAPIDIVQDDQHHEKAIINGISCIRCHDQGLKAPIRVPVPIDWNEKKMGPKPNTLAGIKDEMREAFDSTNILDFEERKIFERLHPKDPDILRKAVLSDFENFTEAEKEATGGLRGALEPIGGLYEEYLRMVDADRLSAELGIKRSNLLSLLDEDKDATESLAVMHNWISKGNAERRERLLQDYLLLVYALGYELMEFTPLGYEEFGGDDFAKLIRESAAFVAIYGKEGTLKRKDREEAVKSLLKSAGARKNLTKDRVLLPGGGLLEVSIQPKLVVGDTAELVVAATEDVHVRIVHLSSDEFVTELYPGSSGKSTLLKQGKERVVRWETTDPGGPEHVVVFASKQPIRVKSKKGAVKAGDFEVYKRDDYFSTRGIPKNIITEDVSTVDKDNGKIPSGIVEAKVSYLLKD